MPQFPDQSAFHCFRDWISLGERNRQFRTLRDRAVASSKSSEADRADYSQKAIAQWVQAYLNMQKVYSDQNYFLHTVVCISDSCREAVRACYKEFGLGDYTCDVTYTHSIVDHLSISPLSRVEVLATMILFVDELRQTQAILTNHFARFYTRSEPDRMANVSSDRLFRLLRGYVSRAEQILTALARTPEYRPSLRVDRRDGCTSLSRFLNILSSARSCIMLLVTIDPSCYTALRYRPDVCGFEIFKDLNLGMDCIASTTQTECHKILIDRERARGREDETPSI